MQGKHSFINHDSSCSVNNMENVDSEENNVDDIEHGSDWNNLSHNQRVEWRAWNFDDSPIDYSKPNDERVNQSGHSNFNIEIPNDSPRGKYDGQFIGGYECEHNQEMDWNMWNYADPRRDYLEAKDKHISGQYALNCDEHVNVPNPQKSEVIGSRSQHRVKRSQSKHRPQVHESAVDRPRDQATYSNESLDSREVSWCNEHHRNPEINYIPSRDEYRQHRMRCEKISYPTKPSGFNNDYNSDIYDLTESKNVSMTSVNELLPGRKRAIGDKHNYGRYHDRSVHPLTSKWRHRSRNRDSHKRIPSPVHVGFYNRARKCRRADKQRWKSRYREPMDCPLTAVTNVINDRSRDNVNHVIRTAEWKCGKRREHSKDPYYSSDYDREFYRSDFDYDNPRYLGTQKYPESNRRVYENWETASHGSEKPRSPCDCCSHVSARTRRSRRDLDEERSKGQRAADLVARGAKRSKKKNQPYAGHINRTNSSIGPKVATTFVRSKNYKNVVGDELSPRDFHVRDCTPSKASMFVETSGSAANLQDSKRPISAHNTRSSELSIGSKRDGEKLMRTKVDLSRSRSKFEFEPANATRLRGCSEQCVTRPCREENINPSQLYNSAPAGNVDQEADYEWRRKVKMKDAFSTTSLTLKQKVRPNRIKSTDAIRIQSSETVAIRKRGSRQMVQTASQTSQTRVPKINPQSNSRDPFSWGELHAKRIWNQVHDTCRNLIKLAVTNFNHVVKEASRPKRCARTDEFVDSANWASPKSSIENATRESRWKSFARSKLRRNGKALDPRDSREHGATGAKRSCPPGAACSSKSYDDNASGVYRNQYHSLNKDPDLTSNYDQQHNATFMNAPCSHCGSTLKYYPSDGRSYLDPSKRSDQKDVYLQSSSGGPLKDLESQKYPEVRDRGGTDDIGDFSEQEEYEPNLSTYDVQPPNENNARNSGANVNPVNSEDFHDSRGNETLPTFVGNATMVQNEEWTHDLNQLNRERAGSDSNEKSSKTRRSTLNNTMESNSAAYQSNLENSSKNLSPCWSITENNGKRVSPDNRCTKIQEEIFKMLCPENDGTKEQREECLQRYRKESNDKKHSEFVESRMRGGCDNLTTPQANDDDVDVCVNGYTAKIFERTQECRKRWMSLINHDSSEINSVKICSSNDNDLTNLFSRSDYETMCTSKSQKQNLDPFPDTGPNWCVRSITGSTGSNEYLGCRNRGGSDRGKVVKRKRERNEVECQGKTKRLSSKAKRTDSTVCMPSTKRRAQSKNRKTDYTTCRTFEEQSAQTCATTKKRSSVSVQRMSQGSQGTKKSIKRTGSSASRKSRESRHTIECPSSHDTMKLAKKKRSSSAVSRADDMNITVCVSDQKFKELQAAVCGETRAASTRRKKSQEVCVDARSSKPEVKCVKKKSDRSRAAARNAEAARCMRKERAARQASLSRSPSCAPRSVTRATKPIQITKCASGVSRDAIRPCATAPPRTQTACTTSGKSESKIVRCDEKQRLATRSNSRSLITKSGPKNECTASSYTRRKPPTKKKVRACKSGTSSISSLSATSIKCQGKTAVTCRKKDITTQVEKPSCCKYNESTTPCSQSRAKSRDRGSRGEGEVACNDSTEVDSNQRPAECTQAFLYKEDDRGRTCVNVEMQTSNTILTQILSQFEFGDKKRRIVMSIRLQTETDGDDDDSCKVDEPTEECDNVDEPTEECDDVDEPTEECDDVDEPTEKCDEVDEPKEKCDAIESSADSCVTSEPEEETVECVNQGRRSSQSRGLVQCCGSSGKGGYRYSGSDERTSQARVSSVQSRRSSSKVEATESSEGDQRMSQARVGSEQSRRSTSKVEASDSSEGDQRISQGRASSVKSRQSGSKVAESESSEGDQRISQGRASSVKSRRSASKVGVTVSLEGDQKISQVRVGSVQIRGSSSKVQISESLEGDQRISQVRVESIPSRRSGSKVEASDSSEGDQRISQGRASSVKSRQSGSKVEGSESSEGDQRISQGRASSVKSRQSGSKVGESESSEGDQRISQGRASSVKSRRSTSKVRASESLEGSQRISQGRASSVKSRQSGSKVGESESSEGDQRISQGRRSSVKSRRSTSKVRASESLEGSQRISQGRASSVKSRQSGSKVRGSESSEGDQRMSQGRGSSVKSRRSTSKSRASEGLEGDQRMSQGRASSVKSRRSTSKVGGNESSEGDQRISQGRASSVKSRRSTSKVGASESSEGDQRISQGRGGSIQSRRSSSKVGVSESLEGDQKMSQARVGSVQSRRSTSKIGPTESSEGSQRISQVRAESLQSRRSTSKIEVTESTEGDQRMSQVQGSVLSIRVSSKPEMESVDQVKTDDTKEESVDQSTLRKVSACVSSRARSLFNNEISSKIDLNYDSDISESIKDSDVEGDDMEGPGITQCTIKPPVVFCTNVNEDATDSNKYVCCGLTNSVENQCVQTATQPSMIHECTSTPQCAILKKYKRTNSTCGGGVCGRSA